MDIDGLGGAMVDVLVEKGWVKRLTDIYRLRRDDLLTLGKSVEKSTDNLLAAIETSKRAELWRVIHGLGITHVGVAAAKDLAKHFGSLEALAAAKLESFIREKKQSVIEGIGETMALYTGLNAIEESLQYDRGLLLRDEAKDKRTVELSTLEGVKLAAHPWPKLIAALPTKPVIEPMAALVPV